MEPVTIIFNSHSGSYGNSSLISSEFDQLSFTGTPETLKLDIDHLSIDAIENFMKNHSSNFILGYMGYDLGLQLLGKNPSKNEPVTSLPTTYLVAIEKSKVKFDEKQTTTPSNKEDPKPFLLQTTVSKKKYIENVLALKKHIQLGNIYEINYCIPFIAENIEIDSFLIWERLCKISPMPFSAFIDHQDFAIISASPERFIKKKASHLFIQPMKGTKAKGKTNEEDDILVEELKNDPKEKSENVMIVDLTRNDLSKVAERGSVTVNKLFGVYSYRSIHQMISTVSCTIDKNTSFIDIVKATFPMGSMTGAPKSRAVDLIDEFENFSRGSFSGMMGYIDPNGDFDFNVMIRTIFYDKIRKKIFVAVGSAITSKSDVEKEYEECLIKLQPLLQALNASIE